MNEAAGKEDPVEFDSSLVGNKFTRCSLGGSVRAILKNLYLYSLLPNLYIVKIHLKEKKTGGEFGWGGISVKH